MSYQSEFWNKYFRFYDVLLKVIPYRHLLETIVKNLELQPGMKILDLGSGTGNLNYFVPKGITVISVDHSMEALALLRKKFPSAEIFQQSILDRLPFEDHSFDRIVANNVLYTLQEENWYSVLREAKRVCKPGGKLVFSNPNKGFSPLAIYKEHIVLSIRQKGVLSTCVELMRLLYPTIMMFKYNKKIKENEKTENYTFIDGHRQKMLLTRMGLRSGDQTMSVYSGQASMDVCDRGWTV